MTQPATTLRGAHVILRDIRLDDLENLRQWRNRPDYRQYFREFRDICPDMQRDWFEQIVCNDPTVRMFAIMDKSNHRLLGACGICYIDLQNCSADFSIYIGADDLYIDQKFAPDAGKLLLEYGFQTLGLHRIWAEIYGIDQAKQILLSSLGFALDGRHREAHQLGDGRWTDCLFYGILRHEHEHKSTATANKYG